MRSEYAIVLYSDEKTNAMLQDLIDKIAEAIGNSYMIDNRIPPHITLATKPDPEQLQTAFSLTVPNAFVGRTEKIAPVKCNPYRETDCYFF